MLKPVAANHRQQGISYLEVLIATVIIAVSLVPALDALKPGIDGAALHQDQAQITFVLQGKLELVLAEPFSQLREAAKLAGSATAETSYSDAAASVPHGVFIWPYDIDNADGDNNVFTGGEDDLLWIRVANSNDSHSLETLISPY
ncbi:MAG: type II secretion system protein [Gammaproteobacteria bacterium]|nr:type II secretion system protein [Gammaproteobacteria bacterium]